MKNIAYPDVELNLVMVHGVYSNADKFSELGRNLLGDSRLNGINMKLSVIDYGTLLLSIGRVPWARSVVSKLVASRLATCTYKYPNAKTVVFAHSFGTWATSKAIEDLFPEFRVDLAILAGSVVPSKFDWSQYPIKVHNFVGSCDKVVLASALWGTGWSGRYGFKNPSDNVTEYFNKWDHNDYPKGHDQYVDIIRDFAYSRGIDNRRHTRALATSLNKGFNYVSAA